MTDEGRRRWEAFMRMHQFNLDNPGDHAAGSPGAAQFAVLANIVTNVQASGSEQAAAVGESGQKFEIKGTKRENMRAIMSEMSTLARSMEYEIDGIQAQFRMPRNRNDADLLNGARAFHSESAQYEADFIRYGIDNHFRDQLADAANEFEASMLAAASAVGERVEATAELEDWVVQGMRARRILDPINRIKYADNPGKLAAWLSASHIEKAPKAKPKPTPTP
jgi:hypothetical protein